MGPTPIRMVSINCFNHSFTWMIQQRRSNSANGSSAPFLLVQHSFPNLRSLVSRERWEKGVIRNGQTWQFSLWQWQSNRPMHANHEGWLSMVESSSYIQKNAARLQAPKCQPWTRSNFLFICFMNILMNLSDHNATVVLLHSITLQKCTRGRWMIHTTRPLEINPLRNSRSLVAQGIWVRLNRQSKLKQWWMCSTYHVFSRQTFQD